MKSWSRHCSVIISTSIASGRQNNPCKATITAFIVDAHPTVWAYGNSFICWGRVTLYKFLFKV